MAKLKGPLFSLGAAQQLGKTLVFFPWKGINAVRTYVVPTNPQTTAQNTQRGYMTTAVANLHSLMGTDTHPITETDQIAWSQRANLHPTPRTWFNEAVKQIVDCLIASLSAWIPSDGTTVAGDTQLAVSIWERFGDTTAGYFWYGTSPSSLVSSKVAVIAAHNATATITSLTNGVKYYWQFKPTAPAGMVGENSGIYHGTPSA